MLMRYSRFKTPKQKSYFYGLPIGIKTEKEESTPQKPILNLNRLIRDESIPQLCSNCGKSFIRYEGMGQYRCISCKLLMYNNYGKVRKCLDITGCMTETQLMEAADLSRREIKRLIEEGSLVRTTRGLSAI